jgi:hypothetical protein
MDAVTDQEISLWPTIFISKFSLNDIFESF